QYVLNQAGSPSNWSRAKKFIGRWWSIFKAEAQVVGGATQVVSGSLIGKSVAGAPLGGLLIMHGAGNMQEGLMTIGDLSGLYPNTPENFAKSTYIEISPEYGELAFYAADIGITLASMKYTPEIFAPLEGGAIYYHSPANSLEAVSIYGAMSTPLMVNDLYSIKQNLENITKLSNGN
ncbi:DUF4225 domain-containing protein, partial [Pseudoalteromonas luteoviolacea]